MQRHYIARTIECHDRFEARKFGRGHRGTKFAASILQFVLDTFYECGMPAGRPASSRYRNRMLRDAAACSQMIMVRCGLCRRSVNYWAHDLIKVLGPHHQVHIPPFPCSRCGTSAYLNVQCTVPSAAEMNSLIVRRPIKQITKWVWQNKKA